MVCQFSKDDGSALVVNSLRKVKMKGKGACVYIEGTKTKGCFGPSD